MNIRKIAVIFPTSALALVTLFAPLLSGAQLTDRDKQFLSAYDKVHQALVADDLAGAKTGAANLGPSGSELAKSKSLEEARAAFVRPSEEAAKLAAGQPGYYVMHCPMKNKDWVQISDKVANPYGGPGMTSCGEIKK